MGEDRKQNPGWPLYFTPVHKSPDGRLESLVVERSGQATIGRLVKDHYRSEGDREAWFPDAQLVARLPDLPRDFGSKIAAAREVVVEQYVAAAGEPADDPPAPPASPAPEPAAGGTMFDDL